MDMPKYLLAVTATLILASGPRASADVVAQAITPTIGQESNVNSFEIGLPPDLMNTAFVLDYWIDFSGGGDTFGYAARDGGNESFGLIENDPAFAILDDSPSIFTGDTIGFIAEDDDDNFFGVADTVNDDTAAPDEDNNGFPDTGTEFSEFKATWEFDVSTAVGGMQLSVDVAAMGDFESFPADYYDWEVSFDEGSTYVEVIRSGIMNTDFVDEDDPAGSTAPIDFSVSGQSEEELPPEVVYTMDSGTVVGWNDPLTMNGEAISNEFETISVLIGEMPEDVDSLYVRLVANTDSGSEGVAFRNLTIEDGFETPLFGDYNNDGTVDAADYTLWRDDAELQNELANPGVMSSDDYDVWVANFGETNVASVAIPEPATALLSLLALAGLRNRR